MIGTVVHINPGPRMDGGPFQSNPADLKLTLVYDHANDVYKLEILDTKNPEFQAIAMFNQDDLDMARNGK